MNNKLIISPFYISITFNLANPFKGFPGGLVVKNPPANAGDVGLIPGSGRSPGEGNGNTLQYSCLRNPLAEEPGRLYSLWVCKEADTTL